MTFAALRWNLKRRFPSLDLDTIEDAILYRYQDILDNLRWSRREGSLNFNSIPEYKEGTVAVTKGGTALAGTDLTWDASMTGRMIRIAARGEWYRFNFDASDPLGQAGFINRPYIGDTDTAASYRINEDRYSFGVNVRNILDVKPLDGAQPLECISREDASRMFPNRNDYGRPKYWTKVFDDGGDPATMRAELLPTPTELRSYQVRLLFDADAGMDRADDNSTFLPWVRPACIEHGAASDLERRMKDRAAAIDEEALYQKLLTEMINMDCQRRGPASMRMSKDYSTNERDYQDSRYFKR